MSFFEMDYDWESGDRFQKVQVSPDDVFEIYRGFLLLDEDLRRVYLLHLLNVPLPEIARVEGLKHKKVQRLCEQAEFRLGQFLVTFVRIRFTENENPDAPIALNERQKRLADRLIDIAPKIDFAVWATHLKHASLEDTARKLNMPPGEVTRRLETMQAFFAFQAKTIALRLTNLSQKNAEKYHEILPLLDELWDIRSECVRKDRGQKNKTFIARAPLLSRADAEVAIGVLQAMEPCARSTYVLSDAFFFEPIDILDAQSITPELFNGNLEDARNTCHTQLGELVTHFYLDEISDQNYLSESETKVARKILQTLPPELQQLVRLLMAKQKSFEEIRYLVDFDVEDAPEMLAHAMEFLRLQMEMLVLTWARLALNKVSDPKEIARTLENPEFYEKYVFEVMTPIEFAINLIEPASREAYLLYYLDDTPQPDIGANLSAAENADQVETILLARFTRQLGIMLMRRLRRPSTPRITRREYELAKKIFLKIGERHRKIYAEYLLSDHSFEHLATRLRLHPNTVRRSVQKAKIICRIEFLSAVAGTLENEQFGSKVGRRILKRLGYERELTELTMPPSVGLSQRIPEDVLEEAGKVFHGLPVEARHLLVMKHVMERDEREIAAVSGTSFEELTRQKIDYRKILAEIAWSFAGGELKNEAGSRYAPRMSDSERNLGRHLMLLIPPESREILKRHLLEDGTMAELAESLRISVDVVGERLDQISLRLGSALEILLIEYLRTGQDDDAPKETAPEETTAIFNEPATDPVIKKEPKQKQLAGVTGSLFGIMTPPWTQTNGWVWPSVLILPAIPFLWVMSLWIGGHACGLAFVRNAPTLQARRWLVKELSHFYFLVIVIPLGIISIIGAIAKYAVLNMQQQIFLIIIGLVLFSCLFVTLVVKSVISSKQWWSGIEDNKFESVDFLELKKQITFNFVFSGILLLVFFYVVVNQVILPLVSKEIPVSSSTFLLGSLALCYFSALLLFRFLLKITKENDSFLRYPPTSRPKKSNGFDEFMFILPCAMFPIAVGLYHFSSTNTRPILTSIEMLISTVCWAGIWWLNVKFPKGRLGRIIGVFLTWLVITRVLRHLIYPMIFYFAPQ